MTLDAAECAELEDQGFAVLPPATMGRLERVTS